jgi:RND family efflux transporter MFP subunit
MAFRDTGALCVLVPGGKVSHFNYAGRVGMPRHRQAMRHMSIWPSSAGDTIMRSRPFARLLFVAFLPLLTLLDGCRREPEVTTPPPTEVVVAHPVIEEVSDWDTYTGMVQTRGHVDVRAQVRGYILEVNFKDGAEVKEGKLLFKIDDGPFQAALKQAEGELKTWKAKLKLAEQQIAIYEPLVKKGSAAKQELDKAFAAKGEAIGAIGSAEGKIMDAKLNIDFCTIEAPVAGKVGEAVLTKGNLVDPAGGKNQLASIVPVEPMYVEFYVNERALLAYKEFTLKQAEKKGATAKKPTENAVIPVHMALANETDYTHKGFIDFADNQVDPGTGSIKVRARFDNPKRPDGQRLLTPGLFARVRVAVGHPYKAVMVAKSAVLTDQNLKYVLVVNKEKNNQVERVDVKEGRLQPSGLVVVTSGLKRDAWVIVDGLTRVRPGVQVNPKEGPMPQTPTEGKEKGD